MENTKRYPNLVPIDFQSSRIITSESNSSDNKFIPKGVFMKKKIALFMLLSIGQTYLVYSADVTVFNDSKDTIRVMINDQRETWKEGAKKQMIQTYAVTGIITAGIAPAITELILRATGTLPAFRTLKPGEAATLNTLIKPIEKLTFYRITGKRTVVINKNDIKRHPIIRSVIYRPLLNYYLDTYALAPSFGDFIKDKYYYCEIPIVEQFTKKVKIEKKGTATYRQWKQVDISIAKEK